MTKEQWRERDRTFNALYEASGGKVAGRELDGMLDALHRAEATLHRIAENDCNGHPNWKGEEDEAWAARDEKKTAATEKRVEAIAAKLGIGVKFNGDPRGGYICLILPNGDRNALDNTWRIAW